MRKVAGFDMLHSCVFHRSMRISATNADRVYQSLMGAQNVLIMSHRNPDPDTLGSNLALRKILERHGKKVTSACVDELPPTCRFLPELRGFVTDFNPNDYDLFIAVDAGSTEQAAFPHIYPQILKDNFLNIDHHPSNNDYGTINLVVEDAASTTIVVLELLQQWKEEITPCIATLLLYGLYYDTGSFMHSNTDAKVLNAASELLSLGAQQELIIKNLYKTRTIEQLRLWGRALDNLELTQNNIAVAGVTSRDLEECNATHSDLSGLIDYVSTIKDSNFATLLSNDDEGNIKGSFRTRRDDINVSNLAQNLGGGGHKKASGFTIKGKLKRDTRWSIVGDEN